MLCYIIKLYESSKKLVTEMSIAKNADPTVTLLLYKYVYSFLENFLCFTSHYFRLKSCPRDIRCISQML